MPRIALQIEYDGSLWQGWQKQAHQQTIQDQIEKALTRFTGTHITIHSAGRTDAGVHATNQIAHFDTLLLRPTVSWVKALNSFLPHSIVIHHAHEVSQDFHARFSAISRTYHYLIYNDAIRSPLLHRRAGWVYRALHLEKMQMAATCLLGKHDFSAFRTAECQALSPIKNLQQVDIVKQGAFFIFTLRADAFLHHMVRNIVGSLLAVGTEKKSASWLAEVLVSGNRHLAAPTFMPDGLYLGSIEYPSQWGMLQNNLSPLDSLFLR